MTQLPRSTTRRRLRWGLSPVVAIALASTTLTLQANADPGDEARQRAAVTGDNVVLQWNQQTVDALAVNNQGSEHPTPPPVGGRTLAIVHEAIYDAWAPYDRKAMGTQLGGDLRRPRADRTENNKRKAISFAAHRALTDLFPKQKATFDAKLRELGYDVAEVDSVGAGSPVDVAVRATDAILDVRHEDGSNQQATPSYATPEGYYQPVNPPQDVDHFDKQKIVDPNHWVPLTVNGQTHPFITPQFADAKPFFIGDPGRYLPPPPPEYGSEESVAAIGTQMERNANLTERQKAIAEHWQYKDSTSSSIPQEWAVFVSRRDHHTLDDDVKLFFALNIAEGDEAVVDWKTKVDYDYGRPITMIRYAMAGQQIQGWAGPNQGTRTIDGSQWRPYLKTPAFAAYGSGHTGFTAAGAEILKQFTGSDAYGGSGTIRSGSSKIETGMPSQDIALKWDTFSDAAQEVGESRLWGGVHWEFDHTEANAQGRKLARDVWREAQQYFNGTHDNGTQDNGTHSGAHDSGTHDKASHTEERTHG
ncbi:vanadium-dependent haloperoxidase [Kitasatospora aureofaciens]|uniref:vanadium-dependent haloperoxidase n=1 Tax=Kitasatospora aureofaciens TaxID=1894 RepID=UPI001C469D24|nr:vanadium-dependent haloperoxidase [Kitasatospora aureofaciens]MBV6699933.1 vanadium-dependent haloperoxidase [Kitasatospora aureofaciens]